MKCALLISIIALMAARSLVAEEKFGTFIGKVRVEWADDGRKMELLKDFIYIDQNGRRWVAPKKSIVDGASIPRLFWSFTGGPFEGLYRNASVVHDVECDRKSNRWSDVHRMFYNAMRCGGVQAIKAKIMYGAVYHSGRCRWPSAQDVNLRYNNRHGVGEVKLVAQLAPQSPQSLDVLLSPFGCDDYLRMKLYIEQHPEISLELIEALTPEFLRKEIGEVTSCPCTLNEESTDPPARVEGDRSLKVFAQPEK